MPPAAAQELNLKSTEIDQIASTCKKNAETAICNMRLYMEASYENVQALLLAVRSVFSLT
jgi:hypothetical protein